MTLAFTIIVLLFTPYLSIHLIEGKKISAWLSPVVICYLIGIALSNLQFLEFSEEISKNAVNLTVPIAIPLLLLSTNIIKWLPKMKYVLSVFSLTILSVCFASFISFFLFKSNINELPEFIAMFTGALTGSAANMNAVGLALQVDTETFLQANIGDLISGGVYLIILSSIAFPILNKILPQSAIYFKPETNYNTSTINILDIKSYTLSLTLGVLIVGLSFGLTFLLFKALNETAFIIILSISSIITAIILKDYPYKKAAYNLGNYLLLVFCVAIGLMVDIQSIGKDSLNIIALASFILSFSVFLNILFARIFKVSADLLLICSTAAVYGPAFIGQIAATVKNKDLIFPGIVCSIVGYAVGNFLGIGMAYLLRQFL